MEARWKNKENGSPTVVTGGPRRNATLAAGGRGIQLWTRPS